MMIDDEAVRHVARLARIRLTSDEAHAFSGELSCIVDWVERLAELDTTGVPATASVMSLALRQREDVVCEGGDVDAILGGAPQAEYGFFSVPRVIE